MNSPAPAPLRAGFVGTGMMGSRMAANLLARGVGLVVHNRTRARAEPLLEKGARWAARPAEVARELPGGVVFTMLSDGAAVRRAVLGRSGIIRGAHAGTLVVDLSTIAPADSRSIAASLAERDLHFVDAPVAGSVGAAERAELTFFAGGAAEDIERAAPFLERMGQRVEPMGPVGSGTAMKLVNNLLTIGHVALAAEALALGESLELPRSRLLELLRSGNAASAMLERKHRNFESRTYPPEFLVPLARKDLRLIEQAARSAGRAALLTREARRLVEETLAQGHQRDDFSSVFEAARLRTPPHRGPPSALPPSEGPP